MINDPIRCVSKARKSKNPAFLTPTLPSAQRNYHEVGGETSLSSGPFPCPHCTATNTPSGPGKCFATGGYVSHQETQWFSADWHSPEAPTMLSLRAGSASRPAQLPEEGSRLHSGPCQQVSRTSGQVTCCFTQPWASVAIFNN